jgi:hypothetical protein
MFSPEREFQTSGLFGKERKDQEMKAIDFLLLFPFLAFFAEDALASACA